MLLYMRYCMAARYTVVVISSWLWAVQAVNAQHPVSQQTPETWFESGQRLMAQGQLAAAYHAFDQHLRSSSVGSEQAISSEYGRAFCAISLFHADGEKQMEEFVERYPAHPRAASAYFDLAGFFYAEKNYQRAATYFEKTDFQALSREQQTTARFKWGYCLFNLKKLDAANEQFSFVKTSGGQYGAAASYYAGFIGYATNNFTSALIDLKRAEQNPAYAPVVPYLIAATYHKQVRDDELIAYAAAVADRGDVNNAGEIALLAAEANFRKGNFSQALSGYDAYLQTNPVTADKKVLFRAGVAAAQLLQYDKAVTYLETAALGKDSLAAHAGYQLGNVYLKSNQKALAVNAFGVARSLAADPRLAEESTFQFAKLSYDLGRSDQAIDALEKFLIAFPQSDRSTEVKEILSQAYVNASNYNKAIAYIEGLPRRGLAVDQAYQKATFFKGCELFNRDDYAGAIQYFDKSTQFPLDTKVAAEAHFWTAEAYSIGRKYEKAIEHYNSVLAEANLPVALLLSTRYGLGYAHYNSEQYDRAKVSFTEFVNKASSAHANLADALVRLADCHYVGKAYTQAADTYRRALAAKTSEPDYVYLQMGIIAGIQRRYDEAARAYIKVLMDFPSSRFRSEAHFQQAQLDFEQGKYAAAATGYTRVIDETTSRFVPYALMRRAASNFNLKDYSKTAADYSSLIDRYPTHPVTQDALLPLQEALTLAGRSNEFDAYLTKFKNANPQAKGVESIEFETAKNQYFNQEYAKAAASLNQYVSSYPQSPRATEARYYRAETAYRQKEFDKALEYFREIEQESSFSMINRVVARVSELEFKAGRFEKALPAYHRLLAVATNRKDQHTAWAGLMEAHYWLAQYDSSERYARTILQQGNAQAGAINKAALFIGKAAMAKGDYELAKDEFLNTLNSARDEYGAEAKYLLGEIFYLTKKHKECRETLISMRTDFAAYPDWVGKAYLLLADNFLAVGDVFQAKATLQSLVDNFPQQNIKDLAVEKLRKIDRDTDRQNVVPDTTDN